REPAVRVPRDRRAVVVLVARMATRERRRVREPLPFQLADAERIDLVTAIVVVTAAEHHEAIALRVECAAAPCVRDGVDAGGTLKALVRGGAAAVPVVELRRLLLHRYQSRVRHLAPMARRQLLDILERAA